MVNIILGITYCIALSTADFRADLMFIVEAHDESKRTDRATELHTFTFRQTSEIRLALSGLVRLYQIGVSPQGPPGCVFTVTCSHFMTQSVQKYGIVHGLLMASDRLCRCTGGGRQYYPVDPESGKAIDYPFESYYIGTVKRIARQQHGE